MHGIERGGSGEDAFRGNMWPMSRLLSAALTLLLLVLFARSAPAALGAAEPRQDAPLEAQERSIQPPAELSQGDVRQLQAAGAALATPSLAEWLGPLAPLALSPFFGVTCLSGIAMLTERGVLPENALVDRAAPLKRPSVFFTFLALTLLTSLPRLTKLSKPLVQAFDFIETWSVVVIVLVVRYLATKADVEPKVAMAGLAFFSADGLLGLLGAVNMVVIATVRFVFEVLVWLSPFPLVDAAFEAGNKAICAGLMAIYAFHPVAALALNLLLFTGAVFAFGWALRQLQYFRGVLLARFGREPAFDGVTLPVYCKRAVGPFPGRQRVLLTIDGEGLLVTRPRRLRGVLQHRPSGRAVLDRGWLQHELAVGDDVFVVPCVWTKQLDSVCAAFEIEPLDGPASPAASPAATALGIS